MAPGNWLPMLPASEPILATPKGYTTERMTLIIAFFRLIRSLNLLFIVLTQCIFQYFIIVPVFRHETVSPVLPPFYFALLSTG